MNTLVTGIVIFALCFCSLNILREIYTFYECFTKMETYNIGNKRMLSLWACISYIISLILVCV